MSTLTDAAPPTETNVATGAATSSTMSVDENREGSARARQTCELYARLSASVDGAERRRLWEEIVTLNVPMAESVAARYRHRGIDDDDLAGVARLALVKAAQRFDPTAGYEFHSYAVPSVRGELQRHFRDHGWTIRPPRRIQEIQAAVVSAETDLQRKLGHPPRASDFAELLDLDISDVEEALSARGCFTPASLDLPVSDESGEGRMLLGDLLPDENRELAAAEARATLGPLVRQLNDRDRRILALRFFHGATQSEIASDIGVTQMHVSRQLARIYADLRKAQAGPTRGPRNTARRARRS